jgi:hypothetical protein
MKRRRSPCSIDICARVLARTGKAVQVAVISNDVLILRPSVKMLTRPSVGTGKFFERLAGRFLRFKMVWEQCKTGGLRRALSVNRWFRSIADHDLGLSLLNITDLQCILSRTCYSFLVTASLGEARVRELNDEINKLIRESRHWERRIRQLGGQKFLREEETGAITESAVSHRGYFYFGAARELPSVTALLDGKMKRRTDYDDKSTEVSLDELSRRVDPQRYFGFEDDSLHVAELKRENDEVQAAVRLWESSGGSSKDTSWDLAWEQFVGRCPPAAEQLEDALDQIALAKRKDELREEVEQMQ